MATQHIALVPTVATNDRPATVPTKPVVQFSLGLRKSKRRELQPLSADANMTIRALILNALKEKGLIVTEEDLLDLRPKGWGTGSWLPHSYP